MAKFYIMKEITFSQKDNEKTFVYDPTRAELVTSNFEVALKFFEKEYERAKSAVKRGMKPGFRRMILATEDIFRPANKIQRSRLMDNIIMYASGLETLLKVEVNGNEVIKGDYYADFMFRGRKGKYVRSAKVMDIYTYNYKNELVGKVDECRYPSGVRVTISTIKATAIHHGPFMVVEVTDR